MKILGLIPARGGSKGLPRKNIKLLDGKPLIQYTIEIAQQSSLLHSVIVSSEDEEIIEVSKSLGAEVPFVRPSELSLDNSTSLSVVQHTLNFYKERGEAFDAVCLLQVTYPFREVHFLDEAIDKFIKEDSDSLISVSKIPHVYNPHWAIVSNKDGYLNIATGDEEIITRRQDLPDAYHRNGSIYITKSSIVLEENSLYGSKMSYIESPNQEDINIDTEEDWKLAEEYLVNRKKLSK